MKQIASGDALPCGNTKVLALGVCATCYTLRSLLAGCGKLFLNGITIVAAFAMPQAGTSGRSSFITGCLGSQT